jgi:hypothetical protein
LCVPSAVSKLRPVIGNRPGLGEPKRGALAEHKDHTGSSCAITHTHTHTHTNTLTCAERDHPGDLHQGLQRTDRTAGGAVAG